MSELCNYCEEYHVPEQPEGEADVEGLLWCEHCREYTITKL